MDDAFLCDLSTINQGRIEGQRAVPNPNVAIELGYAVAQLGWERIVILFNRSFGDFPDDLPFDVDRHRASDFAFGHPLQNEDKLTKKQKAAQTEAMKAPLRQLLYDALEAIWTKKPKRPAEIADIPPAERKKRRDILSLQELLSTIHVPTMDIFLDDITIGHVPQRIFHFWESFHGIVTSRLFHLYDDRARKFVQELHVAWGECLNFGQHFRPNVGGNMFIFGNPGDMPLSKTQQKDWNKMQASASNTRDLFEALINYVHDEYVEIDLEQASANAWREYIQFHISVE